MRQLKKVNEHKTFHKHILPILTMGILVGFNLSENSKTIIGKVNTSIKEIVFDSTLYIEFRADTAVVGACPIQKNGSFNISLKMNPSQSYDIFFKGLHQDELFVKSISTQDFDTTFLSVNLPYHHKKHFGKSICPKCKKHDQTIPVVYGLKVITVFSQHPPPYTTSEGYGRKEIFDGGFRLSEINPSYYCKRDRIKF
ncbi:MAG: hypothetical protein R3A43_01790 [Bacteroidia bacterium]